MHCLETRKRLQVLLLFIYVLQLLNEVEETVVFDSRSQLIALHKSGPPLRHPSPHARGFYACPPSLLSPLHRYAYAMCSETIE